MKMGYPLRICCFACSDAKKLRQAKLRQDIVSKTSATARGGPHLSPGRERALGPRHRGAPQPEPSRVAAAAYSQALPLPEQPPATPPGAATFPSEEHGAATAAADLAPQLAAAQAQLREQQHAISALHDKNAENTAQLTSALVELHELRRQCAPPTSLAPVEGSLDDVD